MDSISKKMEMFLDLLDGKGVFDVNPYLDFRTACRFLRACPADLDEALRESQGMGGDELICDRRRMLLRRTEEQAG